MTNSIFISYRRSDAQHAAFAIADKLQWAFGADEVFLDRSSIQMGAKWPDSISSAVKSAKVVLAVIGPTWLRSADEWGRRRLDDPQDWVRRELCAALAAQAKKGSPRIIPVQVDGAELPHKEALDEALRGVLTRNAKALHNDSWEENLLGIVEHLEKEFKGKLSRIRKGAGRYPNGSPARPAPKQKHRRPMTDAEVDAAIRGLGGWFLEWSPHPWGTGGRAQEIAKYFDFPSFKHAVGFMWSASKAIQQWNPQHNPRWENQWRVVNVYLSTWDVGCRVTKLDIVAAKKFEKLYWAFLSRPTT